MTIANAVKKTILIVEDDFEIRCELQELLEDAGFTVHCASHGEDALDLLPRMPKPALVLLDLLMPVMDGARFLQALRASPSFRDVPVVVVSVKHPPPEGADGYLRKPFDVRALIDLVKSFTDDGPRAREGSPPRVGAKNPGSRIS